MRIIAGRNKGRTLKAPKWDGLRPTSDKLRGTLFNILQHRIDGARVLDVFGGTGIRRRPTPQPTTRYVATRNSRNTVRSRRAAAVAEVRKR